jgi:hypothetical protein
MAFKSCKMTRGKFAQGGGRQAFRDGIEMEMNWTKGKEKLKRANGVKEI